MFKKADRKMDKLTNPTKKCQNFPIIGWKLIISKLFCEWPYKRFNPLFLICIHSWVQVTLPTKKQSIGWWWS